MLLGPELVTPAAPVPSAYPAHGSIPQVSGHAADLGWRTMFGDPKLQRLIEMALEANRDLRIAVLNVEAANAQFRVQRASRLPALELSGSASRERAMGAGSSNGSNATAAPRSGIQEQASLGLGLSSFEIDLFGRVRSQSDAAFARYLASDQGRRSVQLSLVAAVADAYFAERLAQSQLLLAQRTLSDWRQSLDLAQRLKQADQNGGLGKPLKPKASVATAEADLEARERALAQSRNALQLLVGGELPRDTTTAQELDDRSVITRLPASGCHPIVRRRPVFREARAEPCGRQRQHRCRACRVLPPAVAHCIAGVRKSGIERTGWRGSSYVAIRAADHAAPVSRRQLASRVAARGDTQVDRHRGIRTCRPDCFPGCASGLAGTATYGRQIDAQVRVVASAQKRLSLDAARY